MQPTTEIRVGDNQSVLELADRFTTDEFTVDSLGNQIEQLFSEASSLGQQIVTLAEQGICHVWLIGRAALAVKKRLGHGGFVEWKQQQADRLGIHLSTLGNYIASGKLSLEEALERASKSATYRALGAIEEQEKNEEDQPLPSTPAEFRWVNNLAEFLNDSVVKKKPLTPEHRSSLVQLRSTIDRVLGE